MLPNNTIWWLSTNGQKIWIESKDLEQDKFKEKGYNIKRDTIFHTGQAVGELTTSRLESRKRKDAWIVKVESVIDIYPELVEEIRKKEIENKKKKRDQTSKNARRAVPKAFITREAPKKESTKTDNMPDRNVETKDVDTLGDTNIYKYMNMSKDVNVPKAENVSKDDSVSKDTIDHDSDKEPRRIKEPKKDSFDVNGPYVSWIKEEVEKSPDGIKMSFPSIKEKMGGEFMNMHDLRIFFGLQKILLNVGIKVEQGYKAREHAIVMKKIS